MKTIENSGEERTGEAKEMIEEIGEERREEKGNEMRKGEIGVEKGMKSEEKKRQKKTVENSWGQSIPLFPLSHTHSTLHTVPYTHNKFYFPSHRSHCTSQIINTLNPLA